MKIALSLNRCCMQPDSQRYLPRSGRERPARGQLSQRDRTQFGVKGEAGDKGLRSRKAHSGDNPSRLGETRIQQGRFSGRELSCNAFSAREIKQDVCFLSRYKQQQSSQGICPRLPFLAASLPRASLRTPVKSHV